LLTSLLPLDVVPGRPVPPDCGPLDPDPVVPVEPLVGAVPLPRPVPPVVWVSDPTDVSPPEDPADVSVLPEEDGTEAAVVELERVVVVREDVEVTTTLAAAPPGTVSGAPV
jgi:hypothetical protein